MEDFAKQTTAAMDPVPLRHALRANGDPSTGSGRTDAPQATVSAQLDRLIAKYEQLIDIAKLMKAQL